MFENDDFISLARTHEGTVKPVIIVHTDGGPDENPRFGTVINQAIKHFQKFNLDAYFAATNAPGRSAFNRYWKKTNFYCNQITLFTIYNFFHLFLIFDFQYGGTQNGSSESPISRCSLGA